MTKCRVCGHDRISHRVIWYNDNKSDFVCRYRLKRGKYTYHPCKCKVKAFVDLEIVGVEL